MNTDLIMIKKKYGEKMAQLCRNLFPSLLETNGLLFSLLTKNFDESHMLYDDIKTNQLEYGFKNYIYSFTDLEHEKPLIQKNKSPNLLLKEIGYKLYKCRCESDIQRFRKYYNKNEELCTFYNGNRLERCHVFFAVKKNIDDIQRNDFPNPKRQDEYGTSILSIQFTKDPDCTLSIKNRYNHSVCDPDATFSNNLDNIVPGLTEAFERKYSMIQSNKNDTSFEIPGYVKASDGKFYKYNCEINNIYYCPNNIIIDNFKIKKLSKDNYIVLDYLVLNLQNKTISLYDKRTTNPFKKMDSLPDAIGKIQDIKITKIGSNKKIVIKSNDHEKTITLNKENQIIEYEDNNIKELPDDFLKYNSSLINLNTPNIEKIGHRVLCNNLLLESIELLKVSEIGATFLKNNFKLSSINMPNLKTIDHNFLINNRYLATLELPNVEKIGNSFLCNNKILTDIELPKVKIIGDHFLYSNIELMYFEFDNLKKIGNSFINDNKVLMNVQLPNVETINNNFLYYNELLKYLSLPKLLTIKSNFLYTNVGLKHIELPNVKTIMNHFLYKNNSLTSLELENLENIGNKFLNYNLTLKLLNLPKVTTIDDSFLYSNKSLDHLSIPNLENMGYCSLFNNSSLRSSISQQLTETKETGLSL